MLRDEGLSRAILDPERINLIGRWNVRIENVYTKAANPVAHPLLTAQKLGIQPGTGSVIPSRDSENVFCEDPGSGVRGRREIFTGGGCRRCCLSGAERRRIFQDYAGQQ